VHDRGRLGVDQSPQHRQHLLLAGRVEHRGRLVRHQQGGTPAQGRGDGQALQLAPREGGGLLVLGTLQPHRRQDPGHLGGRRRPRAPADVVADPHPEHLALWALGDQRCSARTAEPRHPGPADPPGRGRHPEEHPGQGGLARAIGAHDRGQPAALHPHAQVGESRAIGARVPVRHMLELGRHRPGLTLLERERERRRAHGGHQPAEGGQGERSGDDRRRSHGDDLERGEGDPPPAKHAVDRGGKGSGQGREAHMVEEPGDAAPCDVNLGQAEPPEVRQEGQGGRGHAGEEAPGQDRSAGCGPGPAPAAPVAPAQGQADQPRCHHPQRQVEPPDQERHPGAAARSDQERPGPVAGGQGGERRDCHRLEGAAKGEEEPEKVQPYGQVGEHRSLRELDRSQPPPPTGEREGRGRVHGLKLPRPAGPGAGTYDGLLARMAESADAVDSKSIALRGVRVQVPLRARPATTAAATSDDRRDDRRRRATTADDERRPPSPRRARGPRRRVPAGVACGMLHRARWVVVISLTAASGTVVLARRVWRAWRRLWARRPASETRGGSR
jgi:hypothetical protein